MTALVIVGLCVGVVALVASLEVFARSARSLSVAPTLAPFVRRPAHAHVTRPADLVQLEVLITEAFGAHQAARARVAARLESLGVAVAPEATPAELLAAIEALPSPGEGGFSRERSAAPPG